MLNSFSNNETSKRAITEPIKQIELPYKTDHVSRYTFHPNT